MQHRHFRTQVGHWLGAIALLGTLTGRGLAQTAPPFELENYDYWADLCQVFEAAGKYQEALSACERAIELRPKPREETIPVWVNRGNALRQLERYEEALASYNHVLDLSPDYSMVWMYQCEVLLGMGETELALDTCDRALLADGNWGDRSPAQAWRIRAGVFQDRARQEYEAQRLPVERLLVAEDPDPEALDAAISQMAAVQRTLEEAYRSYDRALVLEPEDSLTLAQQCAAGIQTGRRSRVVGQLKQAKLKQTQWEPADIAALEQHYLEAMALCDRARSGNGRWGDVSPALAWATQGEALQAMAEVQPTFTRRASYLEAAVGIYERAIALDPENPRYWTQQGLILQQLDRYDKALTSYQRAIALDPEDSLALVNQCEMLNNVGDREAALAACEAALQEGSSLGIEGIAQGWNQRSAALIGLGEYEQALASAERAIALYDSPIATRVLLLPADNGNTDVDLTTNTSSVYLDPASILDPGNVLSRCNAIKFDPIDVAARDFNIYLDSYRRALNNKAVSLWYLKRYREAELFGKLSLSYVSVRVPGMTVDARQEVACNYSQGWLNYGRILSELGRYDRAIEAYNLALDTYSLYVAPEPYDVRPGDRNSTATSVRTNACLYIRTNNSAQRNLAPRYINDCANLYLNLSAAYWNDAYLNDRNFSNSEMYAEYAADLDSDSFAIQFNYALAQSKNGNYSGALQTYDAASKLMPEGDETLNQQIVFARAITLMDWASCLWRGNPACTQENTSELLRLRQALNLVEQVLALRPDHTAALDLRDEILQQLPQPSTSQ